MRDSKAQRLRGGSVEQVYHCFLIDPGWMGLSGPLKDVEINPR